MSEPKNLWGGRFTGDADANQFLTRPEYRKPWVLPNPSEV